MVFKGFKKDNHENISKHILIHYGVNKMKIVLELQIKGFFIQREDSNANKKWV